MRQLLSILLGGSLLLGGSANAATLFSDEFDGSELNPGWVRQAQSGVTYSVENGTLKIDHRGTGTVNGAGAERLVVPGGIPGGDHLMEVQVSSVEGAVDGQGPGLFVEFESGRTLGWIYTFREGSWKLADLNGTTLADNLPAPPVQLRLRQAVRYDPDRHIPKTYFFLEALTQNGWKIFHDEVVRDDGQGESDVPLRMGLAFTKLRDDSHYTASLDYFRLVTHKSEARHDINGDGYSDILWEDGMNISAWLTEYDDTSLGRYEPIGNYFPLNMVNPIKFPMLLADFTQDGHPDLLVKQEYDGGYISIVPLNENSPVYEFLIWYPYRSSDTWKIVGSGDVNGDGKTDILWHDEATGWIAAWIMEGARVKEYRYIAYHPLNTNWKIAGTGDFNKDGTDDLLWKQEPSGWVAVWYLKDAAYAGYDYIAHQPEEAWKIAGTGDYNRDGKIDLLWKQEPSGWVAAWLMDGITPIEYRYIGYNSDPGWKIVK